MVVFANASEADCVQNLLSRVRPRNPRRPRSPIICYNVQATPDTAAAVDYHPGRFSTKKKSKRLAFKEASVGAVVVPRVSGYRQQGKIQHTCRVRVRARRGRGKSQWGLRTPLSSPGGLVSLHVTAARQRRKRNTVHSLVVSTYSSSMWYLSRSLVAEAALRRKRRRFCILRARCSLPFACGTVTGSSAQPIRRKTRYTGVRPLFSRTRSQFHARSPQLLSRGEDAFSQYGVCFVVAGECSDQFPGALET